MKKITAVVLHHLNQNQKYLDLCLKGMRAQAGVDLEVIVMASCLEPPQFDDFKGLKVVMIPNSWTTAKATNEGVKLAREESEYVWLCNDDIIPSMWAAYEMAECIGKNPIILNPICPTENGFYFVGDIRIGDRSFERFNSIENVSGLEDEIIQYPRMTRLMFPIEFNCFHATMMRRDLFNRVGGIDERYVNQQEDKDFCLMARRMGANCFITTSAFVFHFGGVSAKYTISDEMRALGIRTFNEKWEGVKNGSC